MTWPVVRSAPNRAQSPEVTTGESVPEGYRISGDARPLVSICSITYNHAKFIAQALDGFLMQETTFPVEIIVHDDCSTDGTAQIIASYHSRYPGRITAILQTENQRSQGRHALPFTLERAKGKYVAICEGDDYWTDPRKLQKQVDFLESRPEFCGCCHLAAVETHLPSGDVITETFKPSISQLSIDDLLRDDPIATCTVLVRRAVLPIRLSERLRRCPMGDWPRWILAAMHGRWACLPDCMAVYVRHGQAVWSSLPRHEQLKRMLPLLELMCEELPPIYRRSARSGWLFRSRMLALESLRADDTETLSWVAMHLAHQRAATPADLWTQFEHQTASVIASWGLVENPTGDSGQVANEIRTLLDRCRGSDAPNRSTAKIAHREVSRALKRRADDYFGRDELAEARRWYRHAVACDLWNWRAAVCYGLAYLGRVGRLCRLAAQKILGTGSAVRSSS